MNTTESANKECDKTFFISGKGETGIAVKQEMVFCIKLETKPSTGYDWSVEPLQDNSIVEYLGEITEEPEEESDNRRFGAPEYIFFRFKALKTGSADIHLKYHRSWEKDVPPIKKCTVRLSVNPK